MPVKPGHTMSMNDPFTGKQVEHFRIERLLGRGGMGSVYYGWDLRLDRPVAIKILDPRYQEDPAFAARFLQEARAVAAWKHPNIIQVYYAGEDLGVHYFAMEYVPGQDLEARLKSYSERGELIPQGEALRIGRAVASALDYAHRQGVIHRDVKPSNILLADDGRVVITDFGLAMRVTEKSLGEVFGSPFYIAPEQARSSASATPLSDLYSLGVILYEMLTGSPPFSDPSPTALAIQHLTLPPPPARERNPDLNAAVEQVLARALSKQPEARYPSGQALIDALEAALAQADEGAEPPTQPLLVSEQLAPDDEVPHRGQPELGPASPHGGASQAPRLMWYSAGCGLTTVLAVLVLLIASFALSQAQAQRSKATEPGQQAQTAVAGLDPANIATRTAPPTTSAVTRTATFEPTPTSRPSDTPLPPSPTPEPLTPTPLPPTITPSATPEPPTAAPPQPAEGQVEDEEDGDFVLYYDDSSFYIENRSGKDRSIYPLSFELLNKDEKPVRRFDGWIWGEIYPNFRTGYCMSLEIINIERHLDPPECRDKILVYRTPRSDANYIFWIRDSDSREFRVLWRDAEVKRCKIAQKTCAFNLPDP